MDFNDAVKSKIDIDTNAIKKASKKVLILVGCFIVFLISLQAIYIVDQTEHAIKIRFNEIIEVNVNNLSEDEFAKLQESDIYQTVKLTYGAGIKFKIPFIDTVETYENRLITYDTQPREVIAQDGKKLILDNNAQWLIIDPYKFKLTMKDENSANRRIEDLMYSKINEKVGQTLSHDLISNKEVVDTMLIAISDDLNVTMEEYGIVIADVRIKRTDYPAENNENIYNRMRTERVQMATQYRSEGKEEATKIRADADMQAAVIVAQAYSAAEQIKGEGEAEAASIYNDAYNRDPEFYEFYMSLETYRETLGNNTKIFIDPASPFAQYIYSPGTSNVPNVPNVPNVSEP